MPTFPLWDRTAKAVSTKTVTIDRAEVENVDDAQARDISGQMRNMAEARMKDGTTHLIALPAGEVQDRLDDDYSEAPDLGGGVFAGLAAAPSEPAPESDDQGKDDEDYDPDPAEDTDG